jgi:glyoxylase-like metal-dependent hydrolase (beta-lactamase superfamily II)
MPTPPVAPVAPVTDPTPRRLPGDVVLLPHVEPFAAAHGMAANAYALLHAGGAVLVDAPFADLLPALTALADAGHPPAALVLTHRHVAAQADALADVARAWGGIPVYLHPADAAHPQGATAARRWGVRFADPLAEPALANARAWDAEVLAFPGHTAGHVAIYRAAAGGVLVAGDAAMGPSVAEAAAGRAGAVRPPVTLSEDDAAIRRAWAQFDRPLTVIAPYHGQPLAAAAAEAAPVAGMAVDPTTDVVTAALAALRRAAPTDGVGLGATA